MKGDRGDVVFCHFSQVLFSRWFNLIGWISEKGFSPIEFYACMKSEESVIGEQSPYVNAIQVVDDAGVIS